MAQVTARYGYTTATVQRYLAVLQAEGIVATGEYTLGVDDREYCDVEVLQQIHRRTLTLLRREIEPVDGVAYARFLLGWQGVVPAAVPGSTGRAAKSAAAGQHALRRALAQLQGVALPPELWERDVLPARVPGYQPAWLDQLCATGELHWAAQDGKLAFYLPDQLGAFAGRLGRAAQAGDGDGSTPEQDRVLGALRRSGADFLGGVARAAGLLPAQTLELLWELAWAGRVTNDTFAPVRQRLRAGRAAARRGRPVPLQGGTGRWSLTERLLPLGGEANPAEAYARILLDRYGVVLRELVQAEDGSAPWSEVLSALKAMELRGHVRQGYFIAELSGAQFALPEVVDRLRAAREAEGGAVHLVAACDPANPYGAALAGRAVRNASTYLVLEGGRPVLAVEAFGKRLVPLEALAGERLRAAVAAIQGVLAGPASVRARRRIEVERWDDMSVFASPVEPLLVELGFERLPDKLVLYR